MFDRLKCKVGIHAWSAWQYTTEGSCAQTRICEHCQAVGNQTQYVWGGWQFTAPDSCAQMSVCQRCKGTENREAGHAWGQWAYAVLGGAHVRALPHAGDANSGPDAGVSAFASIRKTRTKKSKVQG